MSDGILGVSLQRSCSSSGPLEIVMTTSSLATDLRSQLQLRPTPFISCRDDRRAVQGTQGPRFARPRRGGPEARP